MTEALESFAGNVTIGGRSINNLRFADDIDLIAGSMKELAELTERLDKSASAFEMEIIAEKSKIMVTPATKENNTNITITVNDGELQYVKTFKYLGSNITEYVTSVREVKTRLAIATQHLSKLKKIWSSKNIPWKQRWTYFDQCSSQPLFTEAPLSSALWRHRAQSTVLRAFWENGLSKYQKILRIIIIDLFVDDTTSILFIWRGVGIANMSPNYVHVYD